MDLQLSATGWCVGDHFTVADAYLFVTANWASFFKLDLSGLDAIASFMKRMQERPTVQAALKAEGLV